MVKRKLVVKNKRTTIIRLGFIVAIAAAITALAIGAVYFLRHRNIFNNLHELPFTASANYAYTGSGFLYTSGNELKYEDLSDKDKNFTAEISSPQLSLSGSPAISAVYSSSALQILGAQFPVEFSGTVLDVKCGLAKVAVLKLENNGACSLYIYDTKSSPVDQMTFDKQTLVDYGFYTAANTDALWTLTLDTSGSLPTSTLTLYDLGKIATTGVIPIRNQLVEDVAVTPNSIFVIGTNHLIRYTGSSTEAYRLLIYGWELMDYSTSGAKPMFLLKPRNADALGTVKLVTVDEADTANEKILSIQLPEQTLDVFVSGGKLYAATSNTIYIYGSDGTVAETIELEQSIDGIKKLSHKHFLVTRGEQLLLATVR